MQIIRDKIQSNKKIKHFIAYSLTFIAEGCIITGLGPIIPYLSFQYHHEEPEYSFLFFMRSIGFGCGAVLLKYYQKAVSFHKILFTASIALLILLPIFCFIPSILCQGILLFVLSMFCCFIEVMVNVCVLQIQKGNDQQFWLLLCHGFFGVGGLIGPIMVYFFQLNTFLIFGIMMAAISPLYLKLQTPQNHQKIKEKLIEEEIIQEISKAGHDGAIALSQKSHKTKPVTKEIQFIICVMFFIYIGLQCGYGGWISSYAVLQNVATKEKATSFSSIFWISITVFRFISSCVSMKPSKKLLIFLYTTIICNFLTLMFIYQGSVFYACQFSALTFGFGYSSMYPLFLAIPQQNNFTATAKQNTNFIVWGSLGQGVLSMLIGYLMSWISVNMLFIMLFLMVVSLTFLTHQVRRLFQQQIKDRMIQITELIQK